MRKFRLGIILKHVIPFVCEYPWSVFCTFFFYTIGIVLSDIISPLFYREIIDKVSASSFGPGIANELFFLIGIIFGIMIVYNIVFNIGHYVMAYSQSNIMKRLSDYVFTKVIQHSYSFFSNTFSGGLVAKMKRFINGFEHIHDTIIFNFWFIIVSLVGIFIILFRENYFLGLLFIGWMVVYFTITIFFVKYKLRYDLKEAEQDSLVTARFSDVITNVLNLKIFTSQKREQESFDIITKNQEKARRKDWYFNNFQVLVQGVLMMVLEIGALYVTINFWLDGTISVGTVVLVQTFILSIFGKMWNLGKSIGRMIKSFADMQEMVEILEQVPDVLDSKNLEPSKITSGAVEFINTSFKYRDGQKVFHNFNLKIPAGQKVGLVGHSGSGKTTITNLLLRFVDINSGSITIDGQDISTITQNDLRSHISYVPQDPLLFHRSIKENITYVKPDAIDDEIIEASKKARADEFIIRLPNQYDTFVGERGVKLSGGQRQRIAIARIMLENAPLLILDEATSSLDSISEKYIQEAFMEAMKGRTTIVIAHRLSTIQSMDRIIVLDEGEIVEDGTHEELLAKGGYYHKLWSHQASGFILDN